LTSLLLTALKQKITDFLLIPSGGGAFELKVNGELIYSKLQTGRFPDEQWALEAVMSHSKKKK
jgi:selenoprotein W-related protein